MSPSRTTVPLERAYIDTMVFVYHFKQTGSLTQRADRFLKQIENARVHGVTTTFAAAEFVCVMLEALCAKQGTFQKKDVDALRQLIENFISGMGISLYDSDDLVLDVYGKSVIFSKCEQVIENVACVRRRDGRQTVVGGADVLHLTFARNIGVDYYATFDEGFRGAQSIVRARIL